MQFKCLSLSLLKTYPLKGNPAGRINPAGNPQEQPLPNALHRYQVIFLHGKQYIVILGDEN